MNAREIIARTMDGMIVTYPDIDAYEIISNLDDAGFTIMSKEDVEAVRDKALDEAALEADKYCADENIESSLHPALAWSDEQKEWWQCEQLDGALAVSAAIRSLKSK